MTWSGGKPNIPGKDLRSRGRRLTGWMLALAVLSFPSAWAQSPSSAGAIEGRVQDPSGFAVASAPVTIRNVLTGYERSTLTSNGGEFRFVNVPLSSYDVVIQVAGFQTVQRPALVNSSLPVHLDIALKVAVSRENVDVQAQTALVENSPLAHAELDSSLLERLPVSAVVSTLSSVLTLAAPGLAADSNGQLDPMGEEGDATLVVDNEPVSDRQGRNFSSQLSLDAIQSVQVVQGVPAAEYGDKNGLVVRTQTRSGLALSRPTGSVAASYGSFGTANAALTLGVGNNNLGNFLALNGLESGRFLDTPEFLPEHGRGNSESLFDRFDMQVTGADTVHMNVGVSRSWFQVPNTYDQAAAGQDQRQMLRSFNVSPGYSHLFSASTLLSGNAWVRQQRVDYYPSQGLFSDQPATLAQSRRMTTAGLRGDLSYAHGMHNLKAGFQFQYYALSEAFQLGLTDPLFNALCEDSNGFPVVAPGITDPADCAAAGYQPEPDFQQGLIPFDLTRGGQLFQFRGKADIRQEAAYAQDMINLRGLSIMLGLRADNYDGLSHASALQPRVGLSYLVARTQTVLRASYGRLFETPYTDNLIIASARGAGGLNPDTQPEPLVPGIRNQFNVGLQQGFGRHLVVDADYVWKFTSRAYDSDALLDTPLVFPTQFRKAKTDGVAVRIVYPKHHGLSGFAALGHVRARFFGPEVGGLLFENEQSTAPFRIDQDQAFQQTTNVQYQIGARGPWLAFTWRYDSGTVNAGVPDYATALTLTADQQAAVRVFCGNTFATLSNPIRSCTAPKFGASLLYIPAAGTEDPDRNPPRVASRHLFDIGTGINNVLRADRLQLNLRLSVLNLTNKVALYNFLSEFSGTHFVPPRTYQFEAGLSF